MRSRNNSFKHGRSDEKVYIHWSHMKQRCLNPKDSKYKYYGGKGITVCPNWMSFEGFYKDMGDCPDGHSLERNNPHGNYEPSNCSWIPLKKQAQNKCHHRIITMHGKTQTLSQWCDELGLRPYLIAQRIRRDGMDPVRALTKPIGRWNS